MPVSISTQLVTYLSSREVPAIQIVRKGKLGCRQVSG